MVGKRKVKVGRVVGNKMDKTVLVLEETRRRAGLYKKTVTYKAKFKAHDADNACRLGDMVKIMETRPLSKTKRWRVVEVISREGEIEPSAELGYERDDSDSDQA